MEDFSQGQTAYVPFLRADTPHATERRKSLLRRASKSLQIILGIVSLVTFLAVFVVFQILPRASDLSASLIGAKRSLKSSAALNVAIHPPDVALWSLDDFSSAFEEFVATFEKTYENEEEKQRRFRIFHKNVVYINVHNEQNFTYTLKMNTFGDLSREEFQKYYLAKRDAPGYLQKKHGPTREVDWALLDVAESTIPEELDWREKGCVTEVKDQKRCGSCWAFSTTGAVEGAVCARTGVLHSLSEQQLVDCAFPEGNLGCSGGEADWGFQYVIDNRGLCLETDYAYLGKGSGFCAQKECKVAAEIRNFQDVPPRNEKSLRAAVALRGPVSVAIEADQVAFQFYHTGIFTARCGRNLDHATLVVGYGKDHRTGLDYYIMKNSWGKVWGEDGYMRIVRHASNEMQGASHAHNGGECGILEQPSFALP